ncbi:uncharacterized protein [Rutidosis leptorrhynchoides]|uniref:uncharacterized protein n=1 Tax=Rutidosis leptorrhynchoides TaxID=125765 RepID=UPI003A99B39C
MKNKAEEKSVNNHKEGPTQCAEEVACRLEKTSKSSQNIKASDVSFCQGCYPNAKGNWKASSRIMKLRNATKYKAHTNEEGCRRYKNCGSRPDQKKRASNSRSQRTEAASDDSINNVEILSINVRGFGVVGKYGWVKGICYGERPDIAVFQETKFRFLEDSWVQNLWRCNQFGYVQKEACGNSGGMPIIWDSSCFTVSSAVGNRFFIAIRGVWYGSGKESLIVNVYGPHNDIDKKELWSSLDNLLYGHDSPVVLCGDFNEVRVISDRLNCKFNQARATRFNEFIDRNRLIEIPINGKRFTRISDDGLKFSKLDRFLVNEKFINIWDDLSIVPLDRRESDHCPQILRHKLIDYSPKPFKIFDEWLNRDGVDRIIVEAWNKEVRCSRKDCVFRDKLKNAKSGLKAWGKTKFGNIDGEINDLKGEDPGIVMGAILKHFRDIFSNKVAVRPTLAGGFWPVGPDLGRISVADAEGLELPFFEKEIWDAICYCGSSKTPGPDGFNIGFYKKFWSVIKDELVEAYTRFGRMV